MIKKESKGKVTTYKFGKYEVTIHDNPPEKNSLTRNYANAELHLNGEVPWNLNFHYGGKYCSLGDLGNHGITKNETLKATKEIDFLIHCVEKYLYSKGTREVVGRTHPTFAKFMKKRGWTPKVITKHCHDISKRISPKNNPLPLVVRHALKLKEKKKLATKKKAPAKKKVPLKRRH